jgi:adenylate cyclase
VLPFANLSGQPDQDHLSDGLTEDVVTELANVSGLRLVSGDATSSYKGKPVDMERIGRQLGVRYVLEGTTREVGGQLRVTAQLINADDRSHIWAYRYDAPTDQLAQTLDDVTEDVTTQLIVQMRHADLEMAQLKTPDTLQPYDYYLLGKAYLARDDLAGLSEARASFEKALAADASFAYGYGGLANVDFRHDYLLPRSQNGADTLDGVFAAAQRGLSMDTRVSDAYHALANVYLFRRQHDEAIKLLKRVIEETADDADLKDLLGVVYTFAGDPQQGAEATERIMRVNPYYREGIFANLARSYVLTGRLDDAIAQAEICIARAHEFRPCYEAAAVAYAEKGMDAKARAAVDQIRRLDPTFTLVTAPRALPFRKKADLDHFIASLSKAGLE